MDARVTLAEMRIRSILPVLVAIPVLAGLLAPELSQAAISNDRVRVSERVLQEPRPAGKVKFVITITWLQGYPLDGADLCFDPPTKRFRHQLTGQDNTYNKYVCRDLESASSHRLVFNGRLTGRSAKPFRLRYRLDADYGVEGTFEVWRSSLLIRPRR